MSEEEFFLEDRKTKILSIIEKYGENNFYISFSGGMDSVVLSELTDMALPGNMIPRVHASTGLEFDLMNKFIRKKAKEDARIHFIKPSVPIIPSLQRDGYPFKSKNHSRLVDRYQRKGKLPSVESYLGKGEWGPKLQCPKILRYQFTEEFTSLRISDKCCYNMKEKPLSDWAVENGKRYAMIGVMKSEGGRRQNAKCLTFRDGALTSFQPLSIATKEWERWFIEKYNIELCELYGPKWNLNRTGCLGCPFNRELEKELSMMENYPEAFPGERKKAELIFGPVYSEYRRIGYRLKDKGYSLCA